MSSNIRTTIKTDVCSFSEFRIYPGKGKKAVFKDGKVYFYCGSKQASLAAARIKPAKVTWTQAWRRMNKKAQTASGQKRKTHKKVKIAKAIEGITMDELKRKQTQNPKAREAAREAAIKEAREKAQKKKLEHNKTKSTTDIKQQKQASKFQLKAAKVKTPSSGKIRSGHLM